MGTPSYGLIGRGRVASHMAHYLELEGQPVDYGVLPGRDVARLLEVVHELLDRLLALLVSRGRKGRENQCHGERGTDRVPTS